MEQKPIRLLLVEEDVEDRKAFLEFAWESGCRCECTVAKSLAEAQAGLSQGKYDIVICDYLLKDGTVFDLLALRDRPPVVVATAFGNEEVAVRAMREGACDYVGKDPERSYLNALPAIVEKVLERVRLREEIQEHGRNMERMVAERTAALGEEVERRKQAERELRQSQALLRSLLDNIPDMAWLKDRNGVYLAANESFARAVGVSAEEVRGRTSFPRWTKRLQERYRLEDEQVVRRGERLWFEGCVVDREGRTRWFETVKSPVLDPSGAVVGVCGVARDVSERKRAEEEHKRLEEQLRQAQKLEALGTLAGGIAHDFNNLLSIILGNVDLALMFLPEDRGARRYIEEIRKAAQRASDLTQQILAFSRKQILKPTVVNLNEIVRTVEKMLQRLIGENIALETRLKPDIGSVLVDVGQMEQVLMNLAVNARDAMPTGGRLVIETYESDLDEIYFDQRGTTPKPGRYVVLCVADNGKGMDAETLSRIFEPFFTTKETGKGTGLGLSTVYGIVKQSGGYVWVYSEPGGGATFKIYLPVVEEIGAAVGPARQEVFRRQEWRGSETVLVVEDDAMLLDLVGLILERCGYRVLKAGSGEDALRTAREDSEPVHLLLTDVIMPGMSGRELAERMRALRPEVKVLYMSGYTDDSIAHYGMLDPGIDLIAKPFTPVGLADKVREVLDS